MIAIEGVLVVETLPALHICREESENMCVRTWDSGGVILRGQSRHTAGMQLRTHHMQVHKCRFSQSGILIYTPHGFAQTHTFFHTSCVMHTHKGVLVIVHTASKIDTTTDKRNSFRFPAKRLPNPSLGWLRPTSDADRMKLTKYDYERSETVTSMGIFPSPRFDYRGEDNQFPRNILYSCFIKQTNKFVSPDSILPSPVREF